MQGTQGAIYGSELERRAAARLRALVQSIRCSKQGPEVIKNNVTLTDILKAVRQARLLFVCVHPPGMLLKPSLVPEGLEYVCSS